MIKSIKVAVFTFILLLPSIAQAGLINVIDFTGNNEGIAEEFVFTENGVTLSITAWTAGVNSSGTLLNAWTQVDNNFGVYKGSTGLGVRSSLEDGYDLDGGASAQYATDPDEGLLLTFSENVDLLGF